MTKVFSRTGKVCPVCSEGHLTSQVVDREVSYEGMVGTVKRYFAVCDFCESEITGQEESVENVRAVAAFRKSVEKLLSGAEIRAFRKEFSLTQEVAANLFGGGKVAFSRYEQDDISQSVPMDNLIRLCINNPHNIELLAKIRGLTLAQASIEKIEAKYWRDWMNIAEKVKNRLNEELARKYSHSSYRPANEDCVSVWNAPENNFSACAA